MPDVKAAAIALKAGHLVAFPTETVYGLGADAANVEAVGRIFRAKERPTNHPLIVHLGSQWRLDEWGRDIPVWANDLALALWPGPLTVVVRKAGSVNLSVTGGQDTVGLRVPSHPVALELLDSFAAVGGSGVAAPSANRFGRVSPTTADAVRAELADSFEPGDTVIDGGPCSIGLESTIVDCTGDAPAIARPGAVTAETIKEITGLATVVFSGGTRVSGSLPSHYSPRARVVLDREARPGEGLLAPAHYPTPAGVVRLLAARSTDHYAAELYRALRTADEMGLESVVAITPDGNGIAVAVRDRLMRASRSG